MTIHHTLASAVPENHLTMDAPRSESHSDITVTFDPDYVSGVYRVLMTENTEHGAILMACGSYVDAQSARIRYVELCGDAQAFVRAHAVLNAEGVI